jgi:hypothetical protein
MSKTSCWTFVKTKVTYLAYGQYLFLLLLLVRNIQIYIYICYIYLLVARGRDSSVGVATGYGLDSPGIEFQEGRDFSHTSRPALGPTQPPVQWVPGLSRGQSDRGVVLTTHPF